MDAAGEVLASEHARPSSHEAKALLGQPERFSKKAAPQMVASMGASMGHFRPYLFGGLDYWTGLLDWTTGLAPHTKKEGVVNG